MPSQLLGATDSGYDENRGAFNLLLDQRHAAVALPQSAAEVAAAIAAAKARGLQVTVQRTGHGADPLRGLEGAALDAYLEWWQPCRRRQPRSAGNELLAPLRELGPAMDTFVTQPPAGISELRGRTSSAAALVSPMRDQKLAASREAWELAWRQHGVITRAQLMALGFTSKAVKHRVANGRLHPLYRGVYAVGRRQLSRNGRWMAAVLACGAGAVLSHGSAAALWGIGGEWRNRVEISTRRRGRPQRPGLLVRARPSLPAADIVNQHRIPCTSPLRTLLDLATVLSLNSLERAVNEADALDLVDPERLRRRLEHRAGEPGAPALRELLDRDTFRLSDSELEVLFRPLALVSGLPQPLTKVIVNEFEVDFFWPGLGLVVETDSLRYHRTAAKQARDLRRDQTHVACGLVPLRFNHHQIKHEPHHVRAVLTATAARLAAQTRAATGG